MRPANGVNTFYRWVACDVWGRLVDFDFDTDTDTDLDLDLEAVASCARALV